MSPSIRIKTPTFQSTMVDVTPQLAQHWLATTNELNRPLVPSRYVPLQGAIERGEWQFNGDAIRFSTSGVLLDGQNRLKAISESGVTVPCLVLTGLAPSSQQTMDTGSRRTLRDTLMLDGYGNAGRLAAALNYYWRWSMGRVRQVNIKPTITQAIGCLEANPGFQDSLKVYQSWAARLRLNPPVLIACHYEFNQIDPDFTTLFFDALATGANLREGDPVYALRRYLEAHSTTGTKAHPVVQHALLIKTFNAARNGLVLDRISWKAAGARSEQFPTIDL